MTMTIRHSGQLKASANGLHIVYDTFGERTADALLLICGLGDQLVGWRDGFCRQLASMGFFVIRFDNRDAGLSTRFDHAPVPNLAKMASSFLLSKRMLAPYTLVDMANDAVGLLEELAIDTAHVLGGSLGGMIAQTMAIHHPERVRTLISMMSSPMDPTLPKPKLKSLILFLPAPQDRDGYIAFTLRVGRAMHGTGTPFDEADVRQYAEHIYDRGLNPAGTSRQMAAALASGSRSSELQSLRMPTLVIHGAEDPILPVQHGIRTAQLVPGAKLLIIDGLGHELPPAYWPQVVDAIADHARAAVRPKNASRE